MKKYILGWMIILLLITLACGVIAPPTLPTMPSQPGVATVETPVAPTSSPAPVVVTPTTGITPPTIAPTGFTGTPVTYNGVTFVIPDALATNATGTQIPAADDQNAPPWELAPAHINVTLDGYSLTDKFYVPTIYVYPAQEYAAIHPSAAESISRLQAILASPNAQFTIEALPYLPFANAAQIFFAQPKVLAFQNGSGIRFLTEYAQYYATVNNRDLFYHFQGLTSDGRYYIIAILPITASILAADEKPESPVPAGGIPFPGYEASEADMQAYYANITRLLDTTGPDSFFPTLSSLDNMMNSLRVISQ